MAAISAQRVAQTISCCAVHPSGNELAIGSSSSNDVVTFQRSSKGGTWKQMTRLEGHEAAVSGLEYFAAASSSQRREQHPGSGSQQEEEQQEQQQRLASASHDRNGFVWERGERDGAAPAAAEAEPAGPSGRDASGGSSGWRAGELVVTKLDRGATALALAPIGTKLAIGASDGLLSVCYYDEQRKLYAPKPIRGRHRAAVLALAWHPSGAALATAGADGRLRVLSGVLPAVDGAADPPAAVTRRLGDVQLEAALPGGWGLALAFSPDGSTLAAATQGSRLVLLTGIDLSDEATWRGAAAPAAAGEGRGGRMQTLELPGLPLKALAFLSNDLLIGGGFDCKPLVFRRDTASGAWAFDRCLEGLQPGGAGAGRLADRVKMFEAAQVAAAEGGAGGRKRGRGGDPKESSNGGLVHENCIVAVRPLPLPAAAGPAAAGAEAGDGGMLRLLTAGLDGRIVEWEVAR